MAVTAERFAQGLTYEAYKAQMTRNQERFQQNEQRVVLNAADLEPFKRLAAPLHVLALAEDWCGDVIDNLPILGRLAAKSGKLDLRVFLRDQNLDLIDQYLKEGKYRSIPVFVFFDDRFEELGRFIERPASVTERRAQFRRELYAQHPEYGAPDTPVDQLPEEVRVRLQQEMAQKREEWKPLEEQDTIQALRAIVERAAA
jgi:hypothetical protein